MAKSKSVQRREAAQKEIGTPPEGTGQAPAIAPAPQTELVDILQTISGQIAGLAERVEALEKKPAPLPEPQNTLDVKVEKQPTENGMTLEMFLKQVPKEIENTANEILGAGFAYEVDPLPDAPAFAFTVIVPPSMSELPAHIPDRRTKVIPNVLGLNGVTEWCKLIRGSVLKFVNNQI